MVTRNTEPRIFAISWLGSTLLWLSTLGALTARPVLAHGFTVSGTTTVRLGSKVISDGDSKAKVLDAGGNPTLVKPVLTDSGVKIGERWGYKTGINRYTFIDIDLGGTVREVKDVVGQ